MLWSLLLPLFSRASNARAGGAFQAGGGRVLDAAIFDHSEIGMKATKD
jgi:hypothetical protein